jgi:hypothetical protein
MSQSDWLTAQAEEESKDDDPEKVVTSRSGEPGS